MVVPNDEVVRLGLEEGKVVEVNLEVVDGVALPPDLQVALDAVWAWLEPGLRYLKDR
jgi:hypothetical protein